MKQAIIGYITALINNHCRIVDSMTKYQYEKQYVQLHGNSINELNDLLDFVTDIKEEDKEPITVVLNSNEEVEVLKKRIRELEEICQDNNEVIENQFKKIRRLESENMEEI